MERMQLLLARHQVEIRVLAIAVAIAALALSGIAPDPWGGP